MKNYNLSSTFTVLPNNNRIIRPDKEKYNVLNKNILNDINEEKTNYNINNTNNNKRRQYNSAMHINNFNNKRNLDNNIDNNISYSNYQNKELLNNGSINNYEDIDENLDIKFPNNINNHITNSMMNTQMTKNSKLNYYNANLRAHMISNKEKEKINNNIKINTNKEISNIKNESLYNNEDYNDKFFNTFSKINLVNKITKLFQIYPDRDANDTNNYLQNNKNDGRNITIGRNIIVNRKKNRNLDSKEPVNLINKNNYYFSKNRNLTKNYYNNNYNATFENEHINKQNNMYLSRGPSGAYMKKVPNENKDILNFSNNNKQKFSVTKKDLKQFHINEHYIQKIMDNLPQNNNKNIRNNFNYDHRKHYNENNYHSKLNNKDNNVDYYNNNKLSYNNYFKKDLNNNSFINSSLLNNGNLNNNSNNIKTVRVPKYLSVGRGKTIISNSNNDNKYINQKNNFYHQTKNGLNNYIHTYINGFYENKNKNSKLKSPSIKNKYFEEILLDEYNNFSFISYLDIKTILNLSCVSRRCFKKYRYSLYQYFQKILILDKNKKRFIRQVLDSTKKYCSDKLKLKIKNEDIKDYYSSLLKKNEIYDDIILKDLPRTLPNDINFKKGNTNYDRLYNILTCFSNNNKEIGYAQGLNFICAQSIYLFGSEEEVFTFFEGFINIMKMDNFIGVGNEKKMVSKLNEFSEILNRHVPKIIKFFNDKSVSHDFFSTGWILTLFSTSMEPKYLKIVWCFMIIFRWKFVYGFIIQILKKYERYIIKSTEEQLCYKMKNILRNSEFENDFNVIIQNTLDFMKNNIVL